MEEELSRKDRECRLGAVGVEYSVHCPIPAQKRSPTAYNVVDYNKLGLDRIFPRRATRRPPP